MVISNDQSSDLFCVLYMIVKNRLVQLRVVGEGVLSGAARAPCLRMGGAIGLHTQRVVAGPATKPADSQCGH